jgi:ectoine hydroxylase-related dioxygenase (phytanoyl-CoA dioxygenase family)
MTSIRQVDKDRYRETGFLILRGVFSADEVRDVAAETEALLARKELMDRQNLRVRWQVHLETGEPVFELYDPIVDIAPRCSAWARDRRLLDAVGALVEDEAHLFKDKLIYKPAGAGGYPLHQDFIAWPGFPESFTTAVVAIDRADEERGWIEVYPGGHAKGCLAERDGNFHILDDAVVGGLTPIALDLDAGDVAIFGCFMPHRSAPNRSRSQRRHLLFSYNAAREGGEQRAAHYEAFHHYLRSVYSMMGLADMHFR